MKKLFFLLLAIPIASYFISCSDNGSQKKGSAKKGFIDSSNSICDGFDNSDLCISVGGIANFIIPSKQAQIMIGHFDTVYRQDDEYKPISAFDPTYWIDSATIFKIEQFLQSKTKTGDLIYDGIRIYLACEVNPDENNYHNEMYQNKTTIFIFPTTKRSFPTVTSQSTHMDSLVKIPGTNSPYVQENDNASPKIKAFTEFYRKHNIPRSGEWKDSLSKSIWIDQCVISSVAKLLRLKKANLDGVNITMAAYNDNMYYSINKPENLGLLYPNQSTLLIVPTNLDHGKHVPNWDIIDCLYQKLINKKEFFPSALNHGELCPQLCN